MQTLAERFFSREEQQEITRTVQRMEQQTTGEIVPMVVSASHTYPEAELAGAVILATPPALAATLAVGSFFWWQGESLWLFLGFFPVFFLLTSLLVRNIPGLLRLFVRRDRAEAEVKRAAFTQFYATGLQATRDGTGVLIYISVFERRVWILGDHGINEKIPQQTWQQFVDQLTAGIKKNRQGPALCAVIEEIGQLLHAHFPPKSDDRDELSNLIIGGKTGHTLLLS